MARAIYVFCAVLLSAVDLAAPLSAPNPSPKSGGSSPLKILELSGNLPTQPLLVTTAKAISKGVYGLMVSELAPQSKDGAYVRPADPFRTIAKDFTPTAATPGTMLLYGGNPCPWCHRVDLALAARRVPASVVRRVVLEDNPIKASRGGWCFADDRPDPLFGARDLREVYDKLQPGFVGRCTAPLGVDLRKKQPISNESNDLMKYVNSLDVGAYVDDAGVAWEVELRPKELEAEIGAWAEKLYGGLNNGVYRCGFATTQAAYDTASAAVAATLDEVEEQLSKTRYLCGDKVTEADIRLFPTVMRYDGAYSTIFKCGFRRIATLPNVSAWMRDIYQNFGRDTIDIEDAVASYYKWMIPLNPSAIIPRAPDLNLEAPHGRGRPKPNPSPNPSPNPNPSS
uniref:GST C-terminal domain-containing protein n=1 Tax=Phaeomonas parva TaxID=124430 RepID=A0A7S1UKD9_9STRA